MNKLRQMAIFAHIVDLGSITAAAESLQLSKSVISQHLKALEQDIGVTLLKRTTRRQILTSAGSSFYQHCQVLNQTADVAWQQAQQHLAIPQGIVRITAPNALMETLVAPAIALVMQQYPLIEPNLISSDIHLDLNRDNIDLAIRVGESKDSNIKQRRIGSFRDVLCSVNTLHQPAQQMQACYIANSWQSKQIAHHFMSDNHDDIHYNVTASCQTNSFHTCLSLIKAGVGIGLVPDFHLPHYPELTAVFSQHKLPLNAVYSMHPFTSGLPLHVSVCLQAIEEKLALITKTPV
ncbi:LysR family transcriptional regulator [Shewanella sp. MF05960]|uniref:LysR family transcriptional regulator n=1 Tax=Shewanella sp. MF05960 TaxID=3434874 RepID=UPI003D7BB892